MNPLPSALCFGLTIFASAQDILPVLSYKAEGNYLALHVTGTAPAGTTRLEIRLSEGGKISRDAGWTDAKVRLGDDGKFTLDVPLPRSRWGEFQMRAMKGDLQLAAKSTESPRLEFKMLKPERIAALPEGERSAWEVYMKRSAELQVAQYDILAAECRAQGKTHAEVAPNLSKQFEDAGARDAKWYLSDEAGKLASSVISFQTPDGGWSKAVDYGKGPRKAGMHWTSQSGEGGWHYCGTIDNRSSTAQIRFLAGMAAATGGNSAKASAEKGIEWLLQAQYPNGGWPQNFPVETGYHEAITLNDDAMIHVMEVLRDVSRGEPPFHFTERGLRERAGAALQKGISCLVAMQVKVQGRPTVWCAQHDPLTLEPVAARKKEPASLSGGESVSVLKFLMRNAPVERSTTASIEAGTRWLEQHRITGLRKAKDGNDKTGFVNDPLSKETWWARFYDVNTSAPMFAGAEDGIIYATFAEMAAKNRVGYDYYTTKPRDLLEKELPRWRERIAREK